MHDEVLKAVVKAGILANEPMAADALVTIQLGSPKPRLDFEGLRAAARIVGRDFADFVVEQLANRKQLMPFALALGARGVAATDMWDMTVAAAAPTPPPPVAGVEEEEDDPDDLESLTDSHIDDEAYESFRSCAKAFRCQILVDDRAAGSGFLVGPSTVMTAWHVVRAVVESPPPPPPIDVVFLDGRKIPAFVPPPFVSKCSDRELQQFFPKDDAEVADRHDLALLTLRRPAGAHLGFARLADRKNPIRANDSVILIHYPEGRYRGIGIGAFQKLPKLTQRWGHTIRSRGGSSGGGCFNSRFELVGIHQGRAPKPGRGRLVPVSAFPDEVRALVARDEAPLTIWSLDGTVNGSLVIGRQDFFFAFHAASQANGRVRGIHVKRISAASDPGGIPFTFQMLEQLVARTLASRLMRISIETLIPDFAAEVVRRAEAIGVEFASKEPEAAAGAATVMPQEAAARARRAAVAIDAWAGRQGLRVWIFLEHPCVVFGEALRAGFEAFVDQSLKLENIRLVVAGYEAVGLSGMAFRSVTEARGDGPAGLVVEYIAGFGPNDVETLVRQAFEALGGDPSEERVTELVQGALAGIESVNGVFEPWRATQVADALRPELQKLVKMEPPPAQVGHG